MIIVPFRSLIFFCTAFYSLKVFVFSQEQGDNSNLQVEEEVVTPKKKEKVDPLAVLGDPEWTRLRPGWSLTVNDQCLYEFVFQFEHDYGLPVGDAEFKDKCSYGGIDHTEPPKIAMVDGKPYLQPRQMWERFPDYVWATTGFNHLSIDWLPCGRRPKGYSVPQYDFSFFRVTPEYRAETMVCKLIDEDDVAVPGENFCEFGVQDEPKGMNFFILPASMIDRNPVVNMPFTFERPEHASGPIPHYGLRSWDQNIIPDTTRYWTDIPVYMSSYNGNVVMWQPHIPFKIVSGDESKFHSNSHRYFETTLNTLPDTWAVDYDEGSRVITFTMVGKAGICRKDFERAQKAAGGPPVFPNYDDLFAQRDKENGVADSEEGEEREKSESCSFSSASIVIQTLFCVCVGYFLVHS